MKITRFPILPLLLIISAVIVVLGTLIASPAQVSPAWAMPSACEQHDFGSASLQYYVYSDGRSWDFEAETNMVVTDLEVKSVLASTGGTFHIEIEINNSVVASWEQYVGSTTYQPYIHTATISADLSPGDTITYRVYGGTMSTPVGGIAGINYVKLCNSSSSPQFHITDAHPTGNSLAVPQDSTISTTFELPVDFTTVNTRTFTVRGSHTGIYTGTYTGEPVVFDPAQDFKPGERIDISLSSAIESITGTSLIPYAWGFRAAVTGGTGVFADSGQSLGSNKSSVVAIGDVDGDGDLDAFVGNDPADGINRANKIWLNNGQGVYTDSGQSLGNSQTRGVDLGDLDNDGDLDAFVSNLPPNAANKVWLNDGSGGFSDSGQNLGDQYSRSVTLGDVDGDGDLDAFVTNHGSGDRVWLNDGNAIFTDSGQSLGNPESGTAQLGDLDNDGDLDAFVGNGLWSNQPDRVWLNNGLGVFSDSGQRLGSSDSAAIALGDLDGDGDLDAAIGQLSAQPNTVWLNDGTGSFTDSGQSLGNASNFSMALGDVDGDHDLDIFTVNSQAPEETPNTVWLNNGTGHFTDSGQKLDGTRSLAVATLADLDGDGDLDAFVGIEGGNEIWLNSTAPPTYAVYLPLVIKAPAAPPNPPTAPDLANINNTDGDGSYTVSWTAPEGATDYVLEEDDSAAFSSPTTVYSGSDTSYTRSGQGLGTYYYRVKASNAGGESDWSNTESVSVNLVSQSLDLYLSGIPNIELSETPWPNMTPQISIYASFEADRELAGDIDGSDYSFDLYLACAGGQTTAEASIILDHGGTETTLASTDITVTGSTFQLYSVSVTGVDPASVAGDRLILRIRKTGTLKPVVAYGGLPSKITIPAVK